MICLCVFYFVELCGILFNFPLQRIEMYNMNVSEMLIKSGKALVVMGIPYRTNEDCRAIADTLIKDGLQIPNMKFTSAKRMQIYNGIPGVIKIELENVDDKLKALDRSENLKNYTGLGRKITIRNLMLWGHVNSWVF